MESLTGDVCEGAAVHIVAGEGVTCVSEMYSYLVSPAGLRAYLREGISAVGGYPPVSCDGGLTVLPDAAQDYGFPFSCYGSVYGAFLADNALNCRVVYLFAGILEQTCGMGVLCRHAKPGGVLVEAVYRAECELRIKGGEIVPEGVSLMLYGGMHRDSCRLVEYHEPLVLENYRYVQSGIGFKKALILKAEYYLVAGEYLVNAPYDLAPAGDTVFLSFKSGQEPS